MVQISIELIIKRLLRRIKCVPYGHRYINFRMLQHLDIESDFEKFCGNCAKLKINSFDGIYSHNGREIYYNEVFPIRKKEAFKTVYEKVA